MSGQCRSGTKCKHVPTRNLDGAIGGSITSAAPVEGGLGKGEGGEERGDKEAGEEGGEEGDRFAAA